MAQIYRKTAMDKISSPEQLDKALKITSPFSWLALVGLTLIVVVVVIWSIVGRIPETITAQGILTEPKGVCSVFAKESGKVIEVCVDKEQPVHIGTPVLIYETDGGAEETIYSDQPGTVYSVLATKDKRIIKGEEVLRISPRVTNKELVAVCYVKETDAAKIRKRVENVRENGGAVSAWVTLDEEDSQRGHMEARVFTLDGAGTTDDGNSERWAEVLGKGSSLMSEVKNAGANTAVVCEFEFDPETGAGQRWSNSKGKQPISAGQRVKVQIVIKEIAPIKKLFQKLDEIWGGKK